MLESETVLNVCPQCGEETTRGSPPNYLLWCDDPGDACTCYICEACGYIFIPSGEYRKKRYVEEGEK